MMTRKILLFSVLAIALSGCAGISVIENADASKTVISNGGNAFNGGWNFASAEAAQKAREICRQSDKVPVFVGESRTGTPGWSRLSSAITFKCGDDLGKLIEALYNDYKKKIAAQPNLALLNKKIELVPTIESSIPFEIASNNNRPTSDEAEAIAVWAKMRDEWRRDEKKIYESLKKEGGLPNRKRA